MVYLVWEHQVTLSPMLSKMMEKVPNSSFILWEHDASGLDRVLANYPILTDNYLVYFPETPRNLAPIALKYPNNDYLINFTTESNLLDFRKALIEKKVDSVVVDNYNKSELQLVEYVCDSLDVDGKLAKYLVNRCNKYIPRIVEAINTLKKFEVIDKKVIQNYTPRNLTCTYSDVVYGLLKIKTVSKSGLASLLGYYSHGHQHLLGYCKKELELWYFIFSEFDKLSFTYTTLDKFYESNRKNKKLSDCSYKKFKFIVSNYTNVTTNYIYILLMSVEEVLEDFSESKFLNLLLRRYF